jgi:hypothetical protein
VNTSGSGPTLSIGGSLVPFSSIAGTPSASQSFTVNGTLLQDNITITAPANFEVSTNSTTGFGNITTLTQSSGNASGSVFARIAASAPQGVVSGNISISSTNATTRTLAATGSVRPVTVPIPHTQNFETDSEPWFTHSVAGNANWSRLSSTLGNGLTNSTPNGAMQMNGFGSDVPANDWLLIGPFDFSSSGNPGIFFNSLTRFAGNGTLIGELNLKVSTNYSGTGDPSSAT